MAEDILSSKDQLPFFSFNVRDFTDHVGCNSSPCSLSNSYCMQTLMEAVPESWFCEYCKLKKELKCQDILPASLFMSRSGRPKFGRRRKHSQEYSFPRVSASSEKSKVSLDSRDASKADSPSSTPAKRAASDFLNVSNKIPNIGSAHSIQQPAGLSRGRHILSRENSLKVPDSRKVKFLSPNTLAGVPTGGTVNISRSLSGKLSKALAVSQPMTELAPLASTTIKLDFPSSSVAESTLVAAESARGSEGAMPVSCITTASNTSGAAKQMASHRSSYEVLPSFLLSSRPPNVPKGEAFLKYYRDTSVGVCSLQVRDKLVAGQALQTCSADPEKQLIEKSSAETDHEACIEVSMKGSTGTIKVLEQKIWPDTPHPVHPSRVDREMCDSDKVSSTSFQLVENLGSADNCGNACALGLEKDSETLHLDQSKSLMDASYTCSHEKHMLQNASSASVEKPIETSECLQPSYTKEEGVSTLLDTLKSRAKLYAGLPLANDVANLVEVERCISNASTTVGTPSVQNTDSMLLNAKDGVLERKVRIMHPAGADISEIKDVEKGGMQQKSASILSQSSDFVPLHGSTRCYKCKEIGHPAQNCQSRSNLHSLDVHKSRGRASAIVALTKKRIFNRVDATSAAAAVSSSHDNSVKSGHVGLADADFPATTAGLSCERQSSLQDIQMQAEEFTSLEFKECEEATQQCTALSDLIRASVLSNNDDTALCDDLNNITGNSIIDKISWTRKVNDDKTSTGVSAVCKSSLHTSFESGNALQNDESNEKLAALTAGESADNIVVPTTVSTEVQSSDWPIKVPCMASYVPMIDRQLLPEEQSPCSEAVNAGKSLPESGTIGPEIEIMGKRTVPFPGRATFGVTILKVPAVPEPNHLWRGGFQLVAKGKSPLFFDGIKAHPSIRAKDNVYQATRSLPYILELEEIQRGDAIESWPKQFMKKQLSDESIALYFFASDNISFERDYRRLLDHMIVHDLALKGLTDIAELLVFPSSLLPERLQRWKGIMFLWGLFCWKKALKVDDAADVPSSGLPDLGRYQVSQVLSSTRPHVVEGSNVQIPVLLDFEIAGDEDMDVDMEGGKEVGVADVPVRKPGALNTEPASSNVDIISVPSRGLQSQQVTKALEKQDSSCEEVSALHIPQKKLLLLKIVPDNCHSYEKDDKSGELDLPPGFGPLIYTSAITSGRPPGGDNCKKNIDQKQNSLQNHVSASHFEQEYESSPPPHGHIACKDTKVKSLRPSYQIQRSPPFSCSPRETHLDTSILRSRSYRCQYSDSGSELSGYYKKRGKQEKMLERDQFDRNKYGERLQHRDFGRAASYSREPRYRDYKEMERQKGRHLGVRYWDQDKRHNESRMQRDRYHLKQRSLNRGALYSRNHNISYYCSHSRSQSRSRSPIRERDLSHSPFSRYEQRLGRCSSQRGSRSASSSLDSSHKRHIVRRQQSQVNQDGSQRVCEDMQAGVERDLGTDSVNEASNDAQGFLVEKHIIRDIHDSANEEKDKLEKQKSIPVGIIVTEICDSSQEGLAMAESVTKELTCSSENKQLFQSSKDTPYHLFMEEDPSLELTVESDLSSAPERTFFPVATGAVTIDNNSDYMRQGIDAEQVTKSWQLVHVPERSNISSTMVESGSCEDLMRMSRGPSLELALGGKESSLCQMKPLSLFSEQVGILRSNGHSASIHYSAYATNHTSPVCEKLKPYEVYGDSRQHSSLDLTLAVTDNRTQGFTQVFNKEHDENLGDNAVDVSLKL
ncbi:hypothetical protein O6H91_02G038400 [Diphasiastrum complanatum]|uniref:Uncharacterized protein n=1 Tax=Diphasiastrum complanatum TaxID=34168 RepID=A0ACC2EEI7_DIPCM|nr:hypothetical protein O6H91_02G038400 [Diphasiastrum complanatum]